MIGGQIGAVGKDDGQCDRHSTPDSISPAQTAKGKPRKAQTQRHPIDLSLFQTEGAGSKATKPLKPMGHGQQRRRGEGNDEGLPKGKGTDQGTHRD